MRILAPCKVKHLMDLPAQKTAEVRGHSYIIDVTHPESYIKQMGAFRSFRLQGIQGLKNIKQSQASLETIFKVTDLPIFVLSHFSSFTA